MALDLSGGLTPNLPDSRILVRCDGPDGRVAGVELWKRAVYTACRAGFTRLVIVTSRADEVRGALLGDRWLVGRRSDVFTPSEAWAEAVAADGGRWVVLDDRWVVDAAHLRDLAKTSGAPAGSSPRGPIAVDASQLAFVLAERARLNGASVSPPQPLDRPLVYVEVRSPADLRVAEDALFKGLARNVTNFFARMIDRPMSRAISRVLAPFPITPNQITLFSVGLGVVGSLCLLRASYGFGLLGTFLFWLSTVIDGCDGEIARLKFQESAEGARLDVIGDNVVHAFLFPCVALHAYLGDPTAPYLWLGALAFGGVIATWAAIYFIIIHGDPSERVQAYFEVFANREFAYLFLLLGIAGKLHWFVWAMAFGLWIFPLGLVVLDRLGRRR